MARRFRKRRNRGEEESYYVSMTDVMVGVLFIIIILLVYFAYQLKEKTENIPYDVVPRSEYEELEQRYLELDETYKALTVLYYEVHKENKELKDEIQKLIDEIEILKNRIELLEEEIVTLKIENRVLTEQNILLQDLIDELTEASDKLQHLIDKLNELTEEHERLKFELAELLKKNEQLKTRIAELEALSEENERLKFELAELLKKNEQLKTRIAELEEFAEENERLKFELEKLLDENKRLKVRIARLLSEIEQLKTQIEDSETLSDENEFLKTQIEQLEDQISSGQGPLERYLTGVDDTRATILRKIKRYIETDPIFGEMGQGNVEIDTTLGILRLPEGILFEQSKFELLQQSSAENNAELLAAAFANVLPCYTLRKDEGSGMCGDVEYWRCNPNKAFIDVIYVEGHTDSVQVERVLESEIPTSGDHCCGSKFKTDNLRLSSRRATNTLTKIFEKQTVLKDFVNPLEEEVFGAASWGMRRPVILKELIQPMPFVDITRVRRNVPKEEQDAANRRIDVRLLMHTVSSLNALRDLNEQLHRCYAPN